MSVRPIRAKQARNQLGTPGGAENSWEGPKFFRLCPIFLNYVQHIFPGKTKKCRGCCDRKARAASNNRDHMPWSLYYCLFAPHVYGCYSSHTSHSWWIAHSTQRQRRGCNRGLRPSWLWAWGKVVTARSPTRLAQVRSSLLCMQRRVAKPANGLLYSWSLLRNNNTAINLQMFTSSYGSRRFAACDQGSHWGSFSTQICFFNWPVCLCLITKNRVKSVFFEVINLSATSMCSTI